MKFLKDKDKPKATYTTSNVAHHPQYYAGMDYTKSNYDEVDAYSEAENAVVEYMKKTAEEVNKKLAAGGKVTHVMAGLGNKTKWIYGSLDEAIADNKENTW